MKPIFDQILRAERDFVNKMYGIAPNRVLLNEKDIEALREEFRAVTPYRNAGIDSAWFIHGMRIVEDPFATSIEVAYAR